MHSFDTIAAIATAPSTAAVGIVRLSGPAAHDICGRVFIPANGRGLTESPARSLIYGELCDGAQLIDRAMAVYMKAPRSYTGEDMIELHCHGGVRLLSLVLSLLCRHGARMAEPGEYTKRAYLNGKLDLPEAEAVMDLIEADTELGVKNAAGQLSGRLSAMVNDALDGLTGRLTHFFAWMDYGEEDVTPPDMPETAAFLTELSSKLLALADTYRVGQGIREGVRCVVAGRPNAGKSSVINAITGFDRVIVSPVAGTTRDTVEVRAALAGVPLILTDTAGIRDADDAIEAEGVRRARLAMAEAGLILAVFDMSEPLVREDADILEQCGGRTAIALLNKADLPQAADETAIRNAFTHCVSVSAVTGAGFDALEALIRDIFVPQGLRFDGGVVTNARQADLLCRAAAAAQGAERALSLRLADACLTQMEDAAALLGEITGRCAAKEAIDAIFSRFCVGK